jgi:hypothetical protein
MTKNFKKKLLSGSILATTAWMAHQELYPSLEPISEYQQRFGYNPESITPEKILARAKKLHEKLNNPAAHLHDTPDTEHLPYEIFQTTPEKLQRNHESIKKEYWDQGIIPLHLKQSPDDILTLQAEGSPIREMVKEALQAYNEAFPNTQTTMPAAVVVSQKSDNALYHENDDAILIGDNILNLDRKEILALLVHEIRHKAESLSPVQNHSRTFLARYSTTKHLQALHSTVTEDCTQAGLTDEEIQKLLPNDREIFETTKLYQINDFQEWEQHPLEMGYAYARAMLDSKCRNSLTEVTESQTTLLNQMFDETNAKIQEIEYDADFAAARAISPTALANALYQIIPEKERTQQPDETELPDHPLFAARVKPHGCELKNVTVQPILAASERKPMPSFVALHCNKDAELATPARGH